MKKTYLREYARLLVKSGIAVYELAFKQMTLEEYYLNSTGRNV